MLTAVQTGWQPEQRSKPPRSSRDGSLWQVDAPIAVEDCNPRQTRRSHHTIRPQGLRRLLRAAELPARRDHRPIIRLPEAAPSVRCPGPVRRQPSRRHVPADRCEVHRSQHPQRPHRGHPPRLQGRRPAICRHQPLRAHCRAYLRGLPARPALRDPSIQVGAARPVLHTASRPDARRARQGQQGG